LHRLDLPSRRLTGSLPETVPETVPEAFFMTQRA
jgi:hypothetical protein